VSTADRPVSTADRPVSTAGYDLDPAGPYGLHHLPYGSVIAADGRRLAVVRVGDYALDLAGALAGAEHAGLFADGTLDAFLAAGRPVWTAVRAAVTALLASPQAAAGLSAWLLPLSEVSACLPFAVADYVDFYASEDHATNVGRILRPAGEPLTPNWKHMPIGYHGRSGSIVVSGTDVRRPNGQLRGEDGGVELGPSRRLDLEAEVAFVVGAGSAAGRPVAVADFAEHVFGVLLLNDWSARDIQAWEYVPLGPFLGKSFATTVSAWITPLDALAGAWVAPPPRDPPPLPYLDDAQTLSALDLAITITINGTLVSRPCFAGMYWTPAQLLAHLTVNGAALRTGDVLGSGTVSGPVREQRGCLLELSWGGLEPIALDDGSTRTFLADGDEVVLAASANSAGGPVSLGEARGKIVSGGIRDV
jgi:fumarylacetoacetase